MVQRSQDPDEQPLATEAEFSLNMGKGPSGSLGGQVEVMS